MYVYFRSCVGSSSCSWCQVNSNGNRLKSEYCDSSNKCYWGIVGQLPSNEHTPSDGHTPSDDDNKGGLGTGAIVGIIIGVIIAVIVITIIYKKYSSSSKPQRGGPPSQPAQPTPQTSGQAFAVQDGGYSNPAMTPSYPPPQAMYPPVGYPNPPPTAPVEAPPAYSDVVNRYPTKH